MIDYDQRAAHVLARINDLAAISEDAAGITRTFGTEASLRGSQRVKSWMEQAGLPARIDAMGNVRGRLAGAKPGAKTLVIASHIDTVINAGRFDGPLGVLMGLDLVARLIGSGQAVPFHIELIAFSDEEGVRFHTTYLGSNVVAGSFDTRLLARQDASGVTLAEVIRHMGADPARLPADALPPADWLGYVEIHIEQGPVLYERRVPVGIVTAIAGQKRAAITFTGLAGHAGTVPMARRQDALCAAAEFVLAVEQLARAQKDALVATVGKLTVANGASNVIPGTVTCSLDVRSNDLATLDAAYRALHELAISSGNNRRIGVDWNLIQETAPVVCDAALTRLLARSVQDCGYEQIPLVSGAGHDGVPISRVSPVAMLFVRCFEGISHNPLEFVEQTDMAATLRVADTFIQLLIEQYS